LLKLLCLWKPIDINWRDFDPSIGDNASV
jgi:hypothetical protein